MLCETRLYNSNSNNNKNKHNQIESLQLQNEHYTLTLTRMHKTYVDQYYKSIQIYI